MSDVSQKMLHVTMPDGSVWGVPVSVIAHDRAKYYASEFEGDITQSLNEDTLPLFEESPYEVQDWACNNMNWSDVATHAKQITPAPPVDMEEGWANGEKEVA